MERTRAAVRRELLQRPGMAVPELDQRPRVRATLRSDSETSPITRARDPPHWPPAPGRSGTDPSLTTLAPPDAEPSLPSLPLKSRDDQRRYDRDTSPFPAAAGPSANDNSSSGLGHRTVSSGLGDGKGEGAVRMEGRGLGRARLIGMHVSLAAGEEDRVAVGCPLGGWNGLADADGAAIDQSGLEGGSVDYGQLNLRPARRLVPLRIRPGTVRPGTGHHRAETRGDRAAGR